MIVLFWFLQPTQNSPVYGVYPFYSRKDCRGGTTRVQNRFWVRNSEYAGGPWDGSKSHRRRYCHVEVYAWDFEMVQLQIGSKSRITCQNSEMAHFFRPQTLRWLKNRSNLYLEFSFFSNFELSQSFRSEKSELSRSFDTWSRFWAISRTPA